MCRLKVSDHWHVFRNWLKDNCDPIDVCIGVEAVLAGIFIVYIFDPLIELYPSWKEAGSFAKIIGGFGLSMLCYHYRTGIFKVLQSISLRLHFAIISVGSLVIGVCFLTVRPFIISNRNA